MKCVCVQRCQFRGIVPVGTVLELTELELAIPHVKSSFKILESPKPAAATATGPGDSKGDNKGEGKGDGKGTEAPPVGDPDKAPLTGADGAPLPPNAQIATPELVRRLEAAGVRVPDNASRQQLFALLQDTLKPHTGNK
jgi:hypothetical protein